MLDPLGYLIPEATRKAQLHGARSLYICTSRHIQGLIYRLLHTHTYTHTYMYYYAWAISLHQL